VDDETALGPRMTNGIASFNPFKRYPPFKTFNQRRFQVRLSRSKENDLRASRAKDPSKPVCHFDRREKSFLVFLSLGITELWAVTWRE
jgi:hypothetical protein